MQGIRHDITEDFPEFDTAIGQLKNQRPDFGKLLLEYDATDKKIYGIEQQNQPVSDTYIGTLKRHRVVLKDKLYAIIKENVTN